MQLWHDVLVSHSPFTCVLLSTSFLSWQHTYVHTYYLYTQFNRLWISIVSLEWQALMTSIRCNIYFQLVTLLHQNSLIMVMVFWNESDIAPPLPGGSPPQKPDIAAAATDDGAIQDQDDNDKDSQNNASNGAIAQREDTRNCTVKGYKWYRYMLSTPRRYALPHNVGHILKHFM